MSTGSLNQKRVLVTDVDSDFGKDIANALVAEGALVFTLVKECRAMQQVLEEYPQLTPILLDICKEKCEDQARKLILSLPTLDHFVNLSGDSALNIISSCYTNAKIHDVSDTKTKPVIAKMIDSGSRPLIFSVTFGNQNIMSKLKANLDPRFQNSKTSQISTNLSKSLKKMFTSSSGNGGESSRQTTSVTTTVTETTRTEESIVRETHAATNFAAVAATLNQNQEQGSSQNGNSARTSSTANARIQGLQEKNKKIRQGVLKLQKQCAKKWKKAENKIAKNQKSSLKSLHKDIDKSKKIEKANIMKQISDANSSTKSREGALSAETANKILEARENRADKEVEKHAQKKLEKETSKILENKDTQLSEYHEKLYKKMVDREITEFNRIKSKHLL